MNCACAQRIANANGTTENPLCFFSAKSKMRKMKLKEVENEEVRRRFVQIIYTRLILILLFSLNTHLLLENIKKRVVIYITFVLYNNMVLRCTPGHILVLNTI